MFDSVYQDIKYKISQREPLWIFIFACTFLFIFDRTLWMLGLIISNKEIYRLVFYQLAMPLNFEILKKPWTIVTYGFLHTEILHWFFNMLMLYWFGEIYSLYLKDKYFYKVIIGGIVTGGLIAISGYALLPFLQSKTAILFGASAGVEAIIFAATAINPDHELRLLLFGRVKLKYIALFTLLLNYVSIAGTNSGGVLAHLGGAAWGYLFIKYIQSGINLFPSFSQLLPFLSRKKTNLRATHRNWENTANEAKKGQAENEETLNKILDKISASGFESLSTSEKEFLEKFSKH
jgi:membrane associated rhomboid family serine protease